MFAAEYTIDRGLEICAILTGVVIASASNFMIIVLNTRDLQRFWSF